MLVPLLGGEEDTGPGDTSRLLAHTATAAHGMGLGIS
jgi:hypothetical protein